MLDEPLVAIYPCEKYSYSVQYDLFVLLKLCTNYRVSSFVNINTPMYTACVAHKLAHIIK